MKLYIGMIAAIAIVISAAVVYRTLTPMIYPPQARVTLCAQDGACKHGVWRDVPTTCAAFINRPEILAMIQEQAQDGYRLSFECR